MDHLITRKISGVGTFKLNEPKLRGDDGGRHMVLKLHLEIDEFKMEMSPLITAALARGARLPINNQPKYRPDHMFVWIDVFRIVHARKLNDEELLEWVVNFVGRSLDLLQIEAIKQRAIAQQSAARRAKREPVVGDVDELTHLLRGGAPRSRDGYVNRPPHR